MPAIGRTVPATVAATVTATGAGGMDADPAGEWLTISAAARRLGVSRRAIQKRVERNTLRWRPDGNKGRLVLVASSDGRSDGHGEAHGDPRSDGHGDLRQRLAAAEREVELVREMLETERGQHREALAQLRGDRDQLAALLKAALDRPSWLERLARAVRGRI